MTDRSGGPAETEPRIEVGLLTDVGRMRTGNEDSIHVEPVESRLVAKRGLFCAVADGMGGHAAGEVASSLALQAARDAFYNAPAGSDPQEILKSAVSLANAAVYEAGAGTTGRDHMGTTLTAAVVFNHRVVVGHVGDSRCYIVSDGVIRQLSKDHSWVAEEVEAGRMTPEQARVSPRRNIITRALGLRPEVEVDSYQAPLEPNDTIVICSDGLHGLVTEAEIAEHVLRLRPAASVDALVKLANARGGPDNISVVVARVLGYVDDEQDTSREILVRHEDNIATEQAKISDLLAPPPDLGPSLEETYPPAPAFTPPPPPPAPISLPPVEAPSLHDAPTAFDNSPLPDLAPQPPTGPMPPGPMLSPGNYRDDPPFDQDTPTPRQPQPVPEMMLAPYSPQAQMQQQQQTGRNPALKLVTWLLLVIIVGVALGYLIFAIVNIIRSAAAG
ncbi:MAG: Stp1/IreP family PP2C-type Ser/Thr phosphatase [Chloroflexota bacterium]